MYFTCRLERQYTCTPMTLANSSDRMRWSRSTRREVSSSHSSQCMRRGCCRSCIDTVYSHLYSSNKNDLSFIGRVIGMFEESGKNSMTVIVIYSSCFASVVCREDDPRILSTVSCWTYSLTLICVCANTLTTLRGN